MEIGKGRMPISCGSNCNFLEYDCLPKVFQVAKLSKARLVEHANRSLVCGKVRVVNSVCDGFVDNSLESFSVIYKSHLILSNEWPCTA